MDLTEQQVCKQIVYDYFRENGDWLTCLQVEEKMRTAYPNFKISDTEEYQYSAGVTTIYFSNLEKTEKVLLTLSAILSCKWSDQDIEVFVKGVRYCAFRYIIFNKDKVEVSNKEIESNLGISELSSNKFRWIIAGEGLASQAFPHRFDNDWAIIITKKIVPYDGVKSIGEYMEKRAEQQNARFLSGSYKVHTLINPAPIIEKVAQTDPADIQATTANLMQIDNSYYINALNQSQRSFNWALIGGGVGVVFFIAAVFILIFRQPISESYVAAIITASSGGVVETIASIILVLHSRASNQANQCHERLNRMQRFLVAISHCENLESDLKNTTRAELIKKLGDLQ